METCEGRVMAAAGVRAQREELPAFMRRRMLGAEAGARRSGRRPSTVVNRARLIRRRGRVGVPVWATIKADAYGLGAARVARALAEVVEGFCVFALAEAEAIDLWKLTGKPAIALGPPETLDPLRWIEAHVRPAVTTVNQA